MGNEPQITPGPEIDGRKTHLYLFEPGQLASSPLLLSFVPLINAAFSDRHPPWLPSSMIRFESKEGYLGELGPEAFTYGLVYADDTQEHKDLLATVSAKPLKWREPDPLDPIASTFSYGKAQAIMPGAETWEIKLMVVDPRLMGKGLASLLLGMVETESHRRFEERKLNQARISSLGGANGIETSQIKFRLLLQTIYEMNGAFYGKRGYKLIGQKFKEKGFMNSEAGFSVGYLDKTFDF
ncbi:hypothetical protein MMC10_002942 [Thelotrema lepadinum]|nr:hypothetical protein [Thelotrema lepadinum]